MAEQAGISSIRHVGRAAVSRAGAACCQRSQVPFGFSSALYPYGQQPTHTVHHLLNITCGTGTGTLSHINCRPYRALARARAMSIAANDLFIYLPICQMQKMTQLPRYRHRPPQIYIPMQKEQKKKSKTQKRKKKMPCKSRNERQQQFFPPNNLIERRIEHMFRWDLAFWLGISFFFWERT